MVRIGWIGICLIGFLTPVFGQERYRVVSYNVENFFDTRDDSLTRDEDFTPFGRLHWTSKKYTDKLIKLGEVLRAAGEKTFPAFVGLCEVENRRVLTDLTEKTVLADAHYGIVHQDSPDRRGIDVAFLYRQEYFRILEEDFLPLSFPEDTTIRTRDILYVSGVLAGKDTLHFFVCHFPSMYGGESESEWRREQAASVVKKRIDSLQARCPGAAVIIMGDLNGKADRPAQTAVLKTRKTGSGKIDSTELYNTGFYLLNLGYGSYKYKGNWQTIDHIIVSGVLLNGGFALQADPKLRVFSPRFILEEDKTYYGFKPFRTYTGPRYNGGYSDHLPVYLDLKRLKE